MKVPSRYDYLGSTTIFLRKREYDQHQKKLEEIKADSKTKATYYNQQHIEGIKAHNNLKIQSNKFQENIKQTQLSQSNNKILKKIIEISKHDIPNPSKFNVRKQYDEQRKKEQLQFWFDLLKVDCSQSISPVRRPNFDEAEKIMRENALLSSKISQVDSQLDTKKLANQYLQLRERRQRIQRFEILDYKRNQVKLKASDYASQSFSIPTSSLYSATPSTVSKKYTSQIKAANQTQDTPNSTQQTKNELSSLQQSEENPSQQVSRKQTYSAHNNQQYNANQTSPKDHKIYQMRTRSTDKDRGNNYSPKNQISNLYSSGPTTHDNEPTIKGKPQNKNLNNLSLILNKRGYGNNNNRQSLNVSRGNTNNRNSFYQTADAKEEKLHLPALNNQPHKSLEQTKEISTSNKNEQTNNLKKINTSPSHNNKEETTVNKQNTSNNQKSQENTFRLPFGKTPSPKKGESLNANSDKATQQQQTGFQPSPENEYQETFEEEDEVSSSQNLKNKQSPPQQQKQSLDEKGKNVLKNK